jgi:hypothetical protein
MLLRERRSGSRAAAQAPLAGGGLPFVGPERGALSGRGGERPDAVERV